MTPDILPKVQQLLWDNAQIAIEGGESLLSLLHGIDTEGTHHVLPVFDMTRRHEAIQELIAEVDLEALVFCYDGYVTSFAGDAVECGACLGAGCDTCAGQGKQPSRARQDAVVQLTFLPGQGPTVATRRYVKVQGKVLWEAPEPGLPGGQVQTGYPTIPPRKEVPHGDGRVREGALRA